jgi:hypothetical protein
VSAAEGDSLVIGDVVNVAARLEQSAAAGEVLLGETTANLVRDPVTTEPLELSLKGKPNLPARSPRRPCQYRPASRVDGRIPPECAHPYGPRVSELGSGQPVHPAGRLRGRNSSAYQML